MLQNGQFDISFLIRAAGEVLKGLPMTLLITAVAFSAGLVIGFFCAQARRRRIPVLRQLVAVYLSFFRGTPLLVQLYLVYFGLPLLMRRAGQPDLPGALYACIAFSLYSGAYLTNVVQSSMDAVGSDQLEAGASIGLSRMQIMRRIVWPQAFRTAVPLLGNNLTSLLKGTSLAFSIAVMEMTAKATVYGAAGLRFAEAYLAVSVVYLLLCLLIEKGCAAAGNRLRFERRGGSPHGVRGGKA